MNFQNDRCFSHTTENPSYFWIICSNLFFSIQPLFPTFFYLKINWSDCRSDLRSSNCSRTPANCTFYSIYRILKGQAVFSIWNWFKSLSGDIKRIWMRLSIFNFGIRRATNNKFKLIWIFRWVYWLNLDQKQKRLHRCSWWMLEMKCVVGNFGMFVTDIMILSPS